MIDFVLNEEQLAMQTLARDFVKNEVKPIAQEWDHRPDHKDCFQWELVDKLNKVGFRTLTLDKKYGGPGTDSLTTAIVLEELAVGDLGTSVIIAQTAKFVQSIQWECTEEQCRKFLIPFRDNPRGLIATTNTEANLGSDNSSGYPDGVVTTTAVLDGDEWVINGMKQWSSGGAYASLYRVLARTSEGRATFFVPKGTPGLTVGHIHDKLGERLFPTAETMYDNVRVPKGNLAGKPRTKPDPRARHMRASNAFAAACALGVARAAYETAVEYAKTRVQGGKHIIEHQAIGTMLADMFVRIEAGRLLYWKAAWAADHEESYDPKLHAMAKVYCSEVAHEVAVQAMEIHGGYGITKDMPLEKYVRDAVTFLHSDGTRQALKVRTANCLAQGW
ncbi:MAG: acyl-CoA dehydrogenase family protein [Chloroflexota bacterium]